MLPQKILKLRCLEMLFSMLSRQYFGFKNNRSFPQNLNHWLLQKSEMIDLQMLIQKNTFSILSLCCPLRNVLSNVCLGFFGADAILTCESLRSNPVKMSQVFHDTSICFNFSYFHRKVNTFKTPEMCLYLV